MSARARRIRQALIARARRLSPSLMSERGSVLVITIFALTALIGMTSLTVDSGRYFVERRQLQNAADAAALAAARYLPANDAALQSAAENDAAAVATANGLDAADVQVTFLTTAVADDTVAVSTTRTVAFAFARVLGIDSSTVHASSTVQLGSLSGISGVLPFGVAAPQGGLTFGATYCLKLSSNGDDGECEGGNHGDFHALDIDNSGNDSASEYRTRIADGSLTTVQVGEHINVASGNMAGPTQQGLGCTGSDGRLTGNDQTFGDVVAQDPSGGYRVLDWSSPRLAVLPLVTYPGTGDAVVQGFGLFFIDGCGEGSSVTGRFIDTVVRGGEWGAYRPGEGTLEVKITQ